MSHTHRVDFAQQCKQHIMDGLGVADFVNQNADRIAKDSDYLVTIAAESCLLAKQPEQIKELFQQLLRVENSQYKTKLIGKGFEFLAPRNQKIQTFLMSGTCTWHQTTPVITQCNWAKPGKIYQKCQNITPSFIICRSLQWNVGGIWRRLFWSA